MPCNIHMLLGLGLPLGLGLGLASDNASHSRFSLTFSWPKNVLAQSARPTDTDKKKLKRKLFQLAQLNNSVQL